MCVWWISSTFFNWNTTIIKNSAFQWIEKHKIDKRYSQTFLVPFLKRLKKKSLEKHFLPIFLFNWSAFRNNKANRAKNLSCSIQPNYLQILQTTFLLAHCLFASTCLLSKKTFHRWVFLSSFAKRIIIVTSLFFSISRVPECFLSSVWVPCPLSKLSALAIVRKGKDYAAILSQWVCIGSRSLTPWSRVKAARRKWEDREML